MGNNGKEINTKHEALLIENKMGSDVSVLLQAIPYKKMNKGLEVEEDKTLWSGLQGVSKEKFVVPAYMLTTDR